VEGDQVQSRNLIPWAWDIFICSTPSLHAGHLTGT
jgi:hypothetical protein